VIPARLNAIYHPYVPAGMAIHEQLAASGIRPEDLEAVLITNFDIEHVAGMKHVSGAKRIIVPEDEAYWSVRNYRVQ
jgi:glyoxylase-like metal-dependent hydrolase (beta-lactamase superfamily II)